MNIVGDVVGVQSDMILLVKFIGKMHKTLKTDDDEDKVLKLKCF